MNANEIWPGVVSVDDREAALLADYAFHSRDSAGRQFNEPNHPYRGPFQRDRDRILHSAAFRRLSGKMQVFTGDRGDYHRTRLTHTMEVTSIARTMGRALRLNEDLIEALALLHDLGHPPFGHAGEDALHACLKDEGGFSHNQFALTLVQELERPYADTTGLNLSAEVLAGQTDRIDKSRAGRQPILEVQLVDVADSIAYNAHDADDALKLGLVEMDDLLTVPLVRMAADRVGRSELAPDLFRASVVHTLIELQVTSVLSKCGREMSSAGWRNSREPIEAGYVLEADAEATAMKDELQRFLYARVYRHPQLLTVRSEAQAQLQEMLEYFSAETARLPEQFQQRARREGPRRAAAHYLGGMTDRFCRTTYASLPNS